MFRGEIPIPRLWATGGKIGEHSVQVVSNKIVFGDAAADPTTAGDLQRNATSMKFHDGSAVKTLGSGGAASFWQELGRTELGVTSNNLIVSGLQAKKWLLVIAYLLPEASTSWGVRFNDDAGSNYADRQSYNGGADAIGTSRSQIIVGALGAPEENFVTMFIRNQSDKEKLIIMEISERQGAGAGTAPDRAEQVSKWANTTAQITKLDFFDWYAPDGITGFLAGSICIVLGSD